MMENIEDYKERLKTFSTKKLLSQRRYHFWDLDDDEYKRAVLLNEAVYAELDTREHVPNKQEGVSLRQARGRQKRNNGRKGNVNVR